MLNKDMITVFLDYTKLSETSMPARIYDILLACDVNSGWCTSINTLCEQLSPEHRTDFYRSLLLAWLFDIEKFGPVSWGWYKLFEGDEWHLLSIVHSYSVEPGAPYNIKGMHFSPDNMLLFLKDNAEYKSLLTICMNACEEFSKNYKPYEHTDIPISVQINFVTAIDEKVKMIKDMLKICKR